MLRFAPSPNGELHLGHALSALTNAAIARSLGGRLLLRIEDIDPARSRAEHVAGILSDLAWLGIDFEKPVLRQSEHIRDYRAAAARLEALGLLYPCFATRAEIAAAAVPGGVDPDGAPLYPGLWRNAAPERVREMREAGVPFAMRIDMARALRLAEARLAGQPLTFSELGEGGTRTVVAEPARWGDAVIQRKDVATSYHLSVVVDDARQGISHVVRGMDLFAATDLQRLLQVLLGLEPPCYHHHRLILDEHGAKLSKSLGSESLEALRAAGTSAAEVRRRLGFAA